MWRDNLEAAIVGDQARELLGELDMRTDHCLE